jgi:hypothetical protein
MLYLDSLLFLIVIILLCILINKVIDRNKEGFEHKGKAEIMRKRNTQSLIQSAQYGSIQTIWQSIVDKDTHWKGSTDVKPILDQLISAATPTTMVSNITFGGVGESVNAQSGTTFEDNVLIIKFNNTYTRPKDAAGELPQGGGESGGWLKGTWYWMNGEMIDLNFGNVKPDPWWVKIVEAYYKITELLAMILIQMPYRFLTKFVSPTFIFVEFPEMFNNMFGGITDAIKKFIMGLFNIGKRVVKTIFGWIKTAFKKFISILKDIPGFLTSIFNFILDFITQVVDKTFALVGRLWKTIIKIIKTIIKLPLQIFDIISKLIDIIINIFIMIIQLPITILNFIYAFQEIGLDIMSKNPKIPFMDMFFE